MQNMNGMTVAEVGERFGITRASVHDLLGSGQLTASGRAGRMLLIDRSSVERLAAAGTRAAAPGRPGPPGRRWPCSPARTPPGSPSEKSRLKSRLRDLDADAVASLPGTRTRPSATGSPRTGSRHLATT